MPTTLTSRPNKEKMELEEFLSDLGVRDPCEDKERLWPEAREPNKSLWPKLLAGLDPEAKSGFRSKMDNWRKSESPQILCIRGEDGTGKTTMVNALTENLVQDSLEIPETTPARLVEQLRRRTRSKPILVSYFFFQRNDVERNNVLAGLKGLIFRLINQSKDLFPKVNLLRHVPKYDDIGSSFFDGPTGLFVLRKILRNILQDEAISKVYLLLDALDNCSIGMAQLLDLIQDQSYKANWLVTTNRDHVVRDLGPPPVIVIDSKQNASNVSDLINSSLSELVDQKKLDLRCKETTRDFLLKKSGSSFLWITLALKELDLQLLKADSDDFRNLQSGLDPLYEKVMLKIAVKEEDQQLFDFLEEILHWVLLSYRPLHLKELHALITLNESEQGLSEALTLWTPLLITHKNIIYFMHQSTRDYLSSSSYSTSDYHWNIVAKCLELMKRYLRKDLLDPTSVEKQNEIKEVLNVIGYACCYWVDHIVEFLILDKKHEHLSDVSDGGQIHEFLRVYILHWLVALCMMKKGLDSIRMLTSLDSRLPKDAPLLHDIIHDAKRFMLYNQSVIDEKPLQLYSSALVFSPHMSTITNLADKPSGVSLLGGMRNYWSPLIHTLQGHTDWVKSVAFSPDNTVVASGSDDNTVQLWDATTGRSYQMLNVHNSVNSIAFSRDGKLLATASRDHKVRFWKPDTGTEATELAIDHSTPINSVAFSKDTDSKLVALASDDTNIVVYNVPENRQLATLEGHQKWVTEVVFSPHNKYLVSGSGDKTVRIWDIPTGLISETKVSSGSTISPQRTLEVHGGPVNSVASSPTDCGLFASASEDRTVMIWNIETKETKPILTGHSEAVNSIAFSPDGQLLASASDDGTVRLWNVELGVPYGVFKGHSSWIRDISFSSDGQLASASDDKTIKIWDPKMGEIQRLYDEHLYSVTAVAFSPTKHQWYASASEDQTIKLWDRETGAVFATLEGHSNTVNSVRFSPNGELLASCSDDNTIRLWKTNNIEASRKEDKIVKEEAYRLFQGHISEVNSIAFSPDNRLVVSGSSDNRVIIWDIETKKKLTIIRHSHTVRVVAASYNCATGQLLIASASNDHKIKLWRKVKEVPNSNSETLCCYEDWIKTLKFSTDAEENPDSEPERLFPEHGDWVRAIAFSNDGQLLASGSDDNKVRVWSTEKEACVHYATFDSHFDWIRTVIFTPNKELLLSGSDDGTIILWDLAKRLKRATLKGHSAQVNSIDVSSDSQLLVSASNDATVKIWDIKTSEASTLEKHSDNVVAAVFSPDDEQIVSISDDKTVKLWGTKRRELLTPADGDLDPIKKIEFSNKLDRVVSLSEDGVIRFWDLTGKPQNMLKGELDGANCISFSPDGASLVSGSNDNKVRLWDTSTGTGKVANTRNAHLGAVNCIAFLTLPGTPGPKQIVVSGSDDTTIRIWKMEKGNLSMEGVLTGHYDRINSIAYSSRSNLLASASDDKRVMIWNIGKEEPNFEAKFVLVHPSEVKFVDFSGERIVSTSKDNKVWIWDTAKGTLHASLEGQESLVTAIAISPDERFVATASEDNMVKIWSFKRGRVEVPIEKVPAYGPIRKLSFPERGSFLTTDRGPLRPTSLREIGALTSLTDSLPLSEFYVGMEWITRGAAHILRIPLEYQPSTVAIQDKLAIVGLRSGSLLFLTIDLNKVR